MNEQEGLDRIDWLLGQVRYLSVVSARHGAFIGIMLAGAGFLTLGIGGAIVGGLIAVFAVPLLIDRIMAKAHKEASDAG